MAWWYSAYRKMPGSLRSTIPVRIGYNVLFSQEIRPFLDLGWLLVWRPEVGSQTKVIGSASQSPRGFDSHHPLHLESPIEPTADFSATRPHLTKELVADGNGWLACGLANKKSLFTRPQVLHAARAK
jgi:hypothetical protein